MDTVIFDFDGTLADTRESIITTMTETMRVLGRPEADADVMTALIGLPLKEGIRRAAGIEDEKALDDAVALYRKIYQDMAPHSIKLYPGVKETLENLVANGYRLAVATSRGKESLKQMLEVTGIAHLFTVLKADEDVINKKPAPDMVRDILYELDCWPAEAMMVGDTTFDIMMGKGAGVRSCGVTYGNHNRFQLIEAGADYVVDSITEIIPLMSTPPRL
ncbi:MAG: HAD-IA family hydrolase [Muribaculaceae bacterium]|nr:HAD-IA family hydrolase [Muribaculaceae bacterium]